MDNRLVQRCLLVSWMAAAAVPAAVAADGSSLIAAAKVQDWAAVSKQLAAGADVNAKQPDGATALHWASYWEDLKTAQLLLAAGARVNVANEYGVTPLVLACENGNAALVKAFLAAGADPNMTALPTRVTALMTCARTGNADAVAALIAGGAQVNAVEAAHQQTALMWAAAEGHSGAVRALIKGGANVKTRTSVQRVRVATDIYDRSEGEVAPVLDISRGGSTALMLVAARSGDAESAELLLAAGADVNDRTPEGANAVVVAALSGHEKVVQVLLDKGADPNNAGAGYTALHVAVLRGLPGMVKALLAKGANPNVRLVRGTAVPRKSKNYFLTDSVLGATPFFLAAQFDEPEIMRVLAEKGADVSIPRRDGTTPLMAAAGIGWDYERRQRLIDPAEREQAELQDPDTRPLLGSGIRSVKLAVELGADVNATNNAGDTALHGASARGFQTVVRFLVESGARADVKNKRGETPTQIAGRLRRSP